MTSMPRILSLLSFLLVSPSVLAQSFNVDLGTQPAGSALPSSSYGAGAMQMGTWQSVLPTAGSVSLNDVSNTPTGVTLSRTGGAGAASFDNAGTSGDDQNLMDDFQDVGVVGSSTTWTFANLAAGSYALYTYAWSPESAAARTTVSGGAIDPPQQCGGAWPGTQTAGVTYALHHYTVAAGGSIAVTITTTTVIGAVNGLQLVQSTAAPFMYLCFGDGSGTPCPCGNHSPVGANEGCLNSFGTGAAIRATGSPILGADTVVLQGSGMPSTSSALYFQGTTVAGGGAGVVFGDGLRCASGSVVRLATRVNVGGMSQYPGPGDPPVSQQGGVMQPGFRYYQIWYRNSDPMFCTPDPFNLSEVVCVPWG